ncbi:MAG: hypothetical protein F4Z01_01575 [Gammaproteobacteria bacterium]|nr:hypothetical protein [Gammaproteobacteria bacterium]MYF38237.1 hypothetical protein [Gammaproteobacteria bacterium]
MIWPFFSLLMFIMFVPNDQTPHDSFSESPLTIDRSEVADEHIELLEKDCRYLDVPIPHRDLSDFVVLSDNQSEENDDLEVEKSKNEEQADSEQQERHREKPELDHSDREDQE